MSSRSRATSQDTPTEFICPITLQIMVHPLTNRAGRNFERAAILSWLAKSGQDPLTREPMRPSDLISNRLLKTRIRLWRQEHGLREPSEEDLSFETKCEFLGFIPVDSEKEPVFTLASAVSAALPGSSSSNPLQLMEISPQPGERKSNFMKRLLLTVSQELDKL